MIKNRLPPIHPGEYLKEILDEQDISQADFVRTTGLSTMRISHVIRGKRTVNAELALILIGLLSLSCPLFWKTASFGERLCFNPTYI